MSKLYIKYLELDKYPLGQAEPKTRLQLVRWSVGEMAEQIYKSIADDYKTKRLRIKLNITTEEGGCDGKL